MNCDDGSSHGMFNIETYAKTYSNHPLFKYSIRDIMLTYFFKYIYSLLTWETLFTTIFIAVAIFISYLVMDKWIKWRVAKLTVPIQTTNSVITQLPITNHINISQPKFNNGKQPETTTTTIAMPDKFDGTTDFRVWLASFDRYAGDMPDSRKHDALNNLLSLDLQKKFAVYGVSDDANKAFKQLRDALSAIYDKETTAMEPIYELSRRVQQPNESLKEFAGEVEALARRGLPPSQTEFANRLAASQFKNGLNNQWIKEKVLLLKTESLKDLVDEAIRIETIFKQLYTVSSKVINAIQNEQQTYHAHNSLNNPNRQLYNENFQIGRQRNRRHNQNNNNYQSQEYQQPNYNYGQNRQQYSQQQQQYQQSPQYQQQSSQFPNIQQTNQDSNGNPNRTTSNFDSNNPTNSFSFGANTIQSLAAPKNNKLNINGTCLINSNLVNFQADSGADVTVISQDVYEQIKQEDSVLKPVGYQVTNASNESINILGSSLVFFDLGGFELTSPVLVANPLSKPCLLGQDLMTQCPTLVKPITQLQQAVDKITDRSFKIANNQLRTINKDKQKRVKFATQKQTFKYEYESGDDIQPIEILAIEFNPKLAIEYKVAETIEYSQSKPQIETIALTTAETNTHSNENELESYRKLATALLDPVVGSSVKEIQPLSIIKHKISLKDPFTPPIKQKMRRIPHTKREQFKKLIDEMLEANLIRPSNSPWCFPVRLVVKPDNTIRFTVDYVWLNEVTIKDSYPLKNIDDMYAQLAGDDTYSKLDLLSGFYHAMMEEDSKLFTAFATEWGLFEYNVMPMGLSNSPATFQRLMDIVFKDLVEEGIVLVFIDDILVHSKSAEQHLEHLKKVIEVLSKFNMKVKLKKCELFQRELDFLGFRIVNGSITPSPTKTQVLYKYPKPTTLAQLQGFIGLASYYRRFIQGFSKLCSPLYDAVKSIPVDHDVTKFWPKWKKKAFSPKLFEWNDSCENAFNTLRELLTTSPILIIPDLNKEYILDTDACDYAIGAVLSQEKDGHVLPIEYFSKLLDKNQRNYHISEKELMAIVFSVDHFKQYLYGSFFTVNTDHQALAQLQRSNKNNPKLQRWFMELRNYNFKILYKQGKKHTNADGLSRWLLEHEEADDNESIEEIRILSVNKSSSSANQSDLDSDFDHSNDSNDERDPDELEDDENSEFESTDEEDTFEPIYMQRYDADISWIKSLVANHQHVKPKITEFENETRRKLFSQYDRYQIINDVLVRFKEDKNGIMVKQHVLGYQAARRIIKHMHSTIFNGHLGARKTIANVVDRFYRPGIDQIVYDVIRECKVCQKIKQLPQPAKAELKPIIVTRPLELVTMDLVKMQQKSKRGNVYILVVVDHFTKFVQFYAVKNTSAIETAKKLYLFICAYGIPEKILSDQGTNFESELLKYVWDVLDIAKLRTTPYHPQTDGLSERAIQSLLGMLRAFANNQQNNWEEQLECLAYAYNSAVHATTNQTPYFMMFGRKPKMPIDLVLGESQDLISDELVEDLKSNIWDFETILNGKSVIPVLNEDVDVSVKIASEYARELSSRLKSVYAVVNRNKGVKLKQQKINYNRKIKPFTYEEGDLVLKDKPSRTRNGQFRKLGIKFDGPYKIIKILSPLVYQIKNLRPGSKKMNVHHNRLKKYYGSAPEIRAKPDKESTSDDDQNGVQEAASNNSQETGSKTQKPIQKTMTKRRGRPKKLYCICRQPNYGQMVACDNPNCEQPNEWYHFGCMKLDAAPTQWVCPGCRPN